MPSQIDPFEIQIVHARGDALANDVFEDSIEATEDRKIVGWTVQSPTNIENSGQRLLVDAWVGEDKRPDLATGGSLDFADGDGSVSFVHAQLGGQTIASTGAGGFTDIGQDPVVFPEGYYIAWPEGQSLHIELNEKNGNTPGLEIQIFYVRQELPEK